MLKNIINAFKYLIDRLKEPSTHVAIGVLLSTIGQSTNFYVYDNTLILAGILSTTLGIFMAESK